MEIRQLDQIRHCIIFNQVGEGYSGLYRVRAVNCLGEAECEAELSFDGENGGEDMFLPPIWKEKRRLNWRDEDKRKKPFVGFNEPELSSEEIEAMKKGSGLVPLSRITEYLASLPDYVPTNKFNEMEKMPFKAGVDEHDYRPSRKGGSVRFPEKFEKGKIVHRNYNVDGTGRILPMWYDKSDPRSRDSRDWSWKPVHPDLYEPDFPPRGKSPESTPAWEKEEDIDRLIKWLRSLGCHVSQVDIRARSDSAQTEGDLIKFSLRDDKYDKEYIRQKDNKSNKPKKIGNNNLKDNQESKLSAQNVNATPHENKTNVHSQQLQSASQSQSVFVENESEYFTAEITKPIYHKQENLSFPELDRISQPPPALPPKTKIMHSPSRKESNKLQNLLTYKKSL